MSLQIIFTDYIAQAIQDLYKIEIQRDKIQIQPTKKEFKGNYTFVAFTLAKEVKSSPDSIADNIGKWLVSNTEKIKEYNVVNGFLNLELHNTVWISILNEISEIENFGSFPNNGNTIMVEYSSPNTNKPLHLGHLRNNFLGNSLSNILKKAGNTVIKTQIINDRGIHICKSMIAWQKFGNGETPESSGLKGDKLVGKYYVQFDKEYKKEISELIESGKTKEDAEKYAPIFVEAQNMLKKWETNDPEVIELWKKMNAWVYDGFNKTYENLGISFDCVYYESDTYLIGKQFVLEGLDKGIFFRKPDNSVWVDLTDEGMDEKLLLRSDGTSVYITQDIGTAILRFKDYPTLNGQVYTVGNEQDYHFKVLFSILKKLEFEWAQNCYHLSYGMVDLPSGRMKSREGTVVDADDLIEEMVQTAEKHTLELGKIDEFSPEEAQKLYHTIALGALKFFLLKVEPKKRMLFNPEDSIEFQGHTGPFIQYTFARISSILRKAQNEEFSKLNDAIELHETEIDLINSLSKYPEIIQEAARLYSPSIVANFVYDLAKSYNRFYTECSIFQAETDVKSFRLLLSKQTANVIKSAMLLLGINVPKRM